MRTRLLIAAVVGILLPIFAAPTTAQANTCKENQLGTSVFGKKFNCSNGNSFTIKPNLSGSYSDPFSTYKARDRYGNNLNCRYSNFRNSYNCK
jgi:hypothetical protein